MAPSCLRRRARQYTQSTLPTSHSPQQQRSHVPHARTDGRARTALGDHRVHNRCCTCTGRACAARAQLGRRGELPRSPRRDDSRNPKRWRSPADDPARSEPYLLRRRYPRQQRHGRRRRQRGAVGTQDRDRGFGGCGGSRRPGSPIWCAAWPPSYIGHHHSPAAAWTGRARGMGYVRVAVLVHRIHPHGDMVLLQ